MKSWLRPVRVFSIDEEPSGEVVLAEPEEAVVEDEAPFGGASFGEDAGDDDSGLETGSEDPADEYPGVNTQATPETQAPAELGFSLNPRQQAYYEAQELGRDSEWAENRAFDIYEERQAIANLQNNASAHVPVLAQQFEQSGLPAGAAAPYYENLVKLTKQGYRNAAQDPTAQRVALANALGEYMIRQHIAGGTEGQGTEGRRAMVTPTTGGSGAGHSSLSRLSKPDQRFISQWQSTHNGGKPPTSKQLAALEAEGLIG